MNICYIFRQSRPFFFSIEKVFEQVIQIVKEQNKADQVYVPYSKLRPDNFIANLRYVKKQSAEVYHVTGDVHYVVMALPKKKTVLTIHDCVFLEDSKGIKRKILKYLFLEWPVKHAAVITTISEKTKQDIIRYTGFSSVKIRVIYNPISSGIYYKPKPFNTAKPVLLFLGSKEHKNLLRVVEALQGISCHLDIVGNISSEAEKALIKYKISYSQATNITAEQVANKYAFCDIVLFPSLYEGFGLPIIEGNKAGRVVVTSNISPMNEIAANAAYMVDPYSVESIRNGIFEVIENDNERNRLIANGFENVARFHPETIAAQYMDVYNQLTSANDNEK